MGKLHITNNKSQTQTQRLIVIYIGYWSVVDSL